MLFHELQDGWRFTSQMVCLSCSQKLYSPQRWVKQYLKIILSICCNLPTLKKEKTTRNTYITKKFITLL